MNVLFIGCSYFPAPTKSSIVNNKNYTYYSLTYGKPTTMLMHGMVESEGMADHNDFNPLLTFKWKFQNMRTLKRIVTLI